MEEATLMEGAKFCVPVTRPTPIKCSEDAFRDTQITSPQEFLVHSRSRTFSDE